jgi:hypothetical protein
VFSQNIIQPPGCAAGLHLEWCLVAEAHIESLENLRHVGEQTPGIAKRSILLFIAGLREEGHVVRSSAEAQLVEIQQRRRPADLRRRRGRRVERRSRARPPCPITWRMLVILR